MGGAFVGLVGLSVVGISSCVGYELVNESDFSPACGMVGGMLTLVGLINGALVDKDDYGEEPEERFNYKKNHRF